MSQRSRNVLLSLYNFFLFFLLIAFVITCCLMLFTTVLTQTLDITLTEEDLEAAAKLTFVNVVFFSILITAIDRIRRTLTVDRPVKQITDAAKRIAEGDFSVRIRKGYFFEQDNRFNEIIDCFNKMAEELSGTETLRSDFVANVSHELKTPLSVIRNYGTLLQKPKLTEEQRAQYAKAVTEESRKLAELISNILKLSKLENEQIAPAVSIYDLGEQLCECLLGFENAWEAKELSIETDIEDGVWVKSDAEMMSLVWNNLFSNAIKFTENGGTVSLSLKSDGDSAVVRIRDTGCGISSETGKHIFDKFYQGDTSHGAEGNGLGLALVKRVIDITNNDISVESEVGKGTLFTVRLRRVRNDRSEKNM